MASWVGGSSAATASQLEDVVRAVRTTPIIDNHAHPLLKPEALSKHPLLSIATEASGDAIHAAPKTLAHLRAVKQLAKVLKCDLTWESVVAAIEQRRIECPEEWTGQCLAGIKTILLDDGLDNAVDGQDYSWHDSYTGVKCKRIVRIETVAADIINKLGMASLGEKTEPPTDQVFDKMLSAFDNYIKEAIADSEVVAFKSVICYRTGLAIPKTVDMAAAKDAFGDIIGNFAQLGSFHRLQHAGLNSLLVHRTAALVGECASQPKKPIQFHTGLGDNDITLTSSSAAHLQEFIRAYPTVPIVLLHASYPYTREAGYLASVYGNVYLDIGEVFPCLSQDGQETVLRQVLELCPWSKILWSTDGNRFPETYILAVMQVREVLETVLCDYVRRGHIGWKAAVELARDVLFKNSNKLYHLELELDGPEQAAASLDLSSCQTDLELVQAFLKNQPRPDFFRIYWTDLTGMCRMRMVPIRKFMSLLHEGRPSDIAVAKTCLGVLQNDHLVAGVSPTGEYRLHPDFSSLRRGPIEGHVSMAGKFRELSGAETALCPRSLLQRAVELGARHDLSFLLGFEVEFLLTERLQDGAPKSQGGGGGGGGGGGVPLRYGMLTTDGHAWSVASYYADSRIADLLRDMVAQLADAGVFVEQLHTESATGQFELILPPLPPLQAVDTLLQTRETMSALATAAGYRMTLHPKPFAHAPGTGAHTHMSVVDAGPEIYEAFYAGVLKHLRAILAFTYSSPVSYERLADGCWAGGRWVTWGTQNREVPLRKIEGSHWEMKTVDGLANMYLAMGAVLLAGIHGVMDKERLIWGDCQIDPAMLTENDRKELGVERMLPASLEEALQALKEDEELAEFIGTELVERYSTVKEAELKLIGNMGDEERRQWMMERY